VMNGGGGGGHGGTAPEGADAASKTVRHLGELRSKKRGRTEEFLGRCSTWIGVGHAYNKMGPICHGFRARMGRANDGFPN